jgi:hypothetical protein
MLAENQYNIEIYVYRMLAENQYNIS